MRIGGAEQRLGPGHDGKYRVRLAVEAVDQRERLEAVPRELALPDPFGHGDAVADQRGHSGVAAHAPEEPDPAEVLAALPAVAGRQNASQTVEGREGGLVRAARRPGPAQADQRIELAAAVADTTRLADGDVEQGIGAGGVPARVRDAVEADRGLDRPRVHRAPRAGQHAVQQPLGSGEVVGEPGERGETERRGAVGAVAPERLGPAGAHGGDAVVLDRPLGALDDIPGAGGALLGSRRRDEEQGEDVTLTEKTVTLNEVKGTIFGMVPFAALRVTYGRARTYFIASRISPAAAMALSTSRESALACCVAWVRSPSTAATPAERSRSRSKRTFCIASTQDSR